MFGEKYWKTFGCEEKFYPYSEFHLGVLNFREREIFQRNAWFIHKQYQFLTISDIKMKYKFH